MSRRDPGAARGAIPREPGRCACGLLEPLHILRRDGSRGGCPASGCARYTEAEAGGAPASADGTGARDG